MAEPYDRKLKNYIVDWDLQIRMIAHSLIYMFIIAIVTVTLILYPIVCDMVFSEDLEIQYRAAQTFLMVVKRLVPALLVILALYTLHQIIITHRICGPLVNFSHTFRRLAEGDLTRKVYLRQGDYLRKECQKINDMIDGLSVILKRITTNHQKLISSLEDISSHVQDLDTKEKIASSLKIVKNDARYVTETLSVVKLEEDRQG
ncbi:MAG: methyl-accepting chemotaxis protein [Deltaproteobacteria bacterium]|nr:methyl-accepting chemotaxis protein [Deltaproteobacteria bacterium]